MNNIFYCYLVFIYSMYWTDTASNRILSVHANGTDANPLSTGGNIYDVTVFKVRINIVLKTFIV